ncbi:hypothetical protein GUY61_13845 [Streptomyces sp. GC420]|nr:hypothetical protein [Streptomyces sp. GC420]
MTAAVRIPVRIVMLVLVLPVRMAWDALAAAGRSLDRALLRPLGRVLVWLGRVLVVVPAVWLYVRVLTPLGHTLVWLGRVLGVGLVWLGRAVLVWPWAALWRYVLAPLGRYLIVVPAVWLFRRVLVPLGSGTLWLLAALVRWLLVVPAAALWRYVLAPAGRALGALCAVVGREVRDALGVVWRIAGYISAAVGRALAWLGRKLLVEPARRLYATVLTPAGHWVRDAVWGRMRQAAAETARSARAALSSARETVRRARADAWNALLGGRRAPRQTLPGGNAGNPGGRRARTLGSTTTAPSAAPEKG